ncbi:MAG: TlpA family protein disulfide reductase [Chloroflexi bacterium]|nr:MAG: TlpA family protein disulfide reductase [Chloroflexota bacterium]
MSRKRRVQTYHKRQIQSAPVQKKWLYLNLAIALALIVGGVAALFWLGQQTGSRSASASVANPAGQHQTAPDFTLYSPDGQSVSLNDYAGKVILVNHWATWCPPCKAEMPALNAFYEDYKDRGFVVLAVNSQEDAATVKSFIQANGFTFPVVLDTRGQVGTIYRVRGLPTSFIIDRNGVIQYIHSGAITYEQLEKIVQPLL